MTEFDVITPTGDRPEAFNICCHLMEKQKIKPKNWIIVDDGNQHLHLPDFPYIKYVKRIKDKNGPSHTLPCQMLEALKHVECNKIIFMEDDDWYSSDYLYKMNLELEENDLVGFGKNYYYFLKKKTYFKHNNIQHASLCATGFTTKSIHIFNSMNINDPYIDMFLWNTFMGLKKIIISDIIDVMGIKQLPGRIGITYNSDETSLRRRIQNDFTLNFFKKIIGDDFKLYEKYI